MAQNTLSTNQLSPEVKKKVLEARQRAETAFDFKTGHYKQGITDQQKQQLYNDLLDSLVTTDEEYYRFDRTEKQPFIDESEKQKQEQQINALLDRCIEFIGEENLAHHNIDRDVYVTAFKQQLPETADSQELLSHIQLNDLSDKVYQCSYFLYGNPYSLDDFEYYNSAVTKTTLDWKRQMLEPFYEDIYLAIRKAGLLRVIPDAYYPKSMIRIIADNNGLSDYIKEQEKQSNKRLSHKKLAISFYKTQQKWLQNITSYIKGDKTFATSERIKKYCPKEEIGVIKFMSWQDLRRQYAYGYSDYQPQCFRLILSDELFDFLDSKDIESKKYFDFDKWGRSFKKNITEREKIEAVNNELDRQVVTDLQLYRLNRWKKPVAYISSTSHIEKASELLSQCISDLGLKRFSINTRFGAIFEDDTADYLYRHTEDSILEPLVKQCTTGLYGENYNPIHFMKMPLLHGNKKQAEQAYIKAYLLIKEDKLLRVTPSAFYPLSLVKEQAKESGFDEFLLKKEVEMKKEKMDYQKALIEFYGSYKDWTIAVSDFINEQK